MNHDIKIGLQMTRRIVVDDNRITTHLGEGLGVYATPFLAGDIESLCNDLAAAHLEEGQGTVGTRIDIKHTAVTPKGMWVELTATIKEVDRRALQIEIEAHDQFDQVASCQHSRFIIELDQVKQRVADKIARAGDVSS